MRVLLDCRMSTWSGVGRYTTGLARALAARDDVELLQVCRDPKTAPVVPGREAELALAPAHPFTPRGVWEFGRLARRVRPDVVHCPHFLTPVPAWRPLVVTLHDVIPLSEPDVMPSGLKRAVYRRANERALHIADRLIVPSAFTAAELYRLLPGRLGAKGGALTVIPEAADDFTAGQMGALPEKIAGLTTSPYLLTMGNTKPHKDLPTLLAAFAVVARSRPDLRLLLVGAEPAGYLKQHLSQVVPGVGARAVFTGSVTDEELRALYSGATAFVFPSRYEGFGLPVLEAMAFGTPVVCAEASSLPEVAGHAALFFPPGDVGELANVLSQVLGDDVLRRSLGEAGRMRAAEFSWQRTAQATVDVYEQAIAQRDVIRPTPASRRREAALLDREQRR